jgi:Flp pilus assembly protein TadG
MKHWQQILNKWRDREQSQAGIATAEMAVLTPLLLFMFLATADFGRVFYTAITLAHAARAGAQYGSFSLAKSGNTAGMNQAATQEAQNIGAITVTSQRFCKCSTGGTVNCVTGTCGAYGPPQVFVQTTAGKTFQTVVPYPGIPSPLSLSRTAIMRVQ